MLPKKERLTKRDFTGAKTSVIFRGTLVDIAILRSASSGIACVIAKKRVKRATERNYIKRKVYHSIKENIHFYPKKAVVVYPKATVLTSQYKDLCLEIVKGFATL